MITVPNFDISPSSYNLIKAKEKNNQGLCGFENCSNILGSPKGPFSWCSIKICDKCFNERKAYGRKDPKGIL